MPTPNRTPGPWHVGLKPGPMVYGPQGEQIVGLNVMLDSDEVLANAKFIAAAPAMYEALKALHSVLDQRMPDGRTLNQHLSQEVFECFYGPAIAARAAIAKAEGA